jgi:hypothetical protein
MDNNPVIYAMIAVFLALGEAVGEHTLQRADGLAMVIIGFHRMSKGEPTNSQ